jgi:DNA-binding HxlR family transcriptional regulator
MRKQRHVKSAVEACPMEVALDIVGGKWKGVVLFRLADGPVRFNALQRAICRITARSLTQALRELEADGMVRRTIHPTIPPNVDYTLTDAGRALLPVLTGLMDWSRAHVYGAALRDTPGAAPGATPAA